VVLLQWTDSGPRRCGSGARGAAAFAAGASGVVLAGDVNSFSAGIAGDPRLPMMLVVKQGAEALKGAVDAAAPGAPVLVTLTSALHNAVRIDLSGTPEDPTDRIASFSSRGFGTALAVKPDVTAPGVTVFSADVGTGTEGISDSGTSMAAPHVAGIAALVRAANPSWTVEQVKAAILGTAGAPVRAEAGGTVAQSPVRAGVGRVQADEAVRATTLAYDADVSGAVNLSFGDVAVTADTTLSKGLTVQNTSSTSRRYRLAYRPAVSTPGVTFTVSPSAVLVPARSSVKVLVSMKLTPAAMRRTADPSASTEEGQASYYTDAGGAVAVTPTDGAASTQRPVSVAVYAAPRPASEMTAAPTAVVGSTGNGPLALVGAPLLQGAGGDPATDPTLYASTVSALMLQGTSPQRPDCTSTVVIACTPFPEERSGDLRYVGVASDVPYTRDAFSREKDADSGFAYFGVTTWGPWRTPASYAEFDVYVDTDAGSPTHTPEPELVLFNSRLAADSDVMVATLGDLRTGQIIDQEPLNGALGSLDTGLFHSDSMVLPLWLPLLTDYLPKGADGRPASTRVNYWVQAGTVESGVTDAVGSQQRPLSVDLRSPALRAAGDSNGPVLNSDAPRRAFSLAVRRDLRTYAADAPKGLLLVHHQNLNGARAQVVSVRGFTSTALRSSATSFGYGGRPVLTATVRGTSGAPATGSVTFRDGSTVLGTAPLRDGVATLRPAALPWGSRSVSAGYSGSALDAPSASPALRITVAGRATAVTLRSSAVAFGAGGRPTLTAAVSPSSSTGTVLFRDGDRVLGRAPVVRGRAVLRAPALTAGTHLVRATYEGSASSRPSTSAALRLRVR
ncbi:MAG TPA: Ig-like domain repeat protein, partial [Actinomycetales bacterium]